MGKTQYKKRIRSARHHANGIHVSPGSLPTNPSPEEALEVSSKSKKKKNKSQNQQKEREATISVLDKITSPSSHDRVWSLAAISNLVLSSQSTRQLFLSKNLIRLLIDRLKEDQDHYDVLVEVTGVLRNLVIEGGKEVCGEMANKGILQPLSILVSKLVTSINQVINGAGGEKDTVQSLVWAQLTLVAENVIIVLWSLSETSNKWLDSVGNLQDIVPLLSTILKLFIDHIDVDPTSKSAPARSTIPSSCALASGQCLYALTEDNRSLAIQLISPDEELIQPLIFLFDTFEKKNEKFSNEDQENLELLKVVSVGILRNIMLHAKKRAEKLSFKSAYDEKMPQILTTNLHVNLAQLATGAAEANQDIPPVPLSDINIAKASFQEPSQAEVKLESIERRLTVVQLSLELFGEWCASADGFDCDDDDRSTSGSDADEAKEVDETSDGSKSGDMEMQPSENGDLDMEEIPTTVACETTDTLIYGVESHNEPKSDAMEIEESGSFLPMSHAALFSNLLDQLRNLAQPTPYIHQSPQADALPKDTIPAAANTNEVTSPTLSGVIPVLVNELLCSIHLRATDALNNMMITIDRLEGKSAHFANQFISINQEPLSQLWNACWSTISELFRNANLSHKGKEKVVNGSMLSHQQDREQLLISTVTCFWSLSRVLLKHHTQVGILQVTTEYTYGLINLLRLTQSKTLKTRVLSTLICFGGRPNVSVEENGAIGDLLMDIISNSDANNSALLIEALDGVFDVYADETRDYDEPVFQKRKFLDHLKSVVPQLQSIVKRIDKRKDPTLRQHAEEVQNNLIAFIDYRKSLMSCS